MQLHFFETKLPNLKLKTRPKQLLGSLPLVIALPVLGRFADLLFFCWWYLKDPGLVFTKCLMSLMQTFYKLFMNYLLNSRELITNFLQIYYKCLTDLLQTSYRFITNVLQISYKHLTDLLQTSYRFITNVLRISYKHLTDFLQTSYIFCTNFSQPYCKPLTNIL